MSPTVSLILDLVVAGLLIATIVYAVILNRQLIDLRESRGEMEALIRSFGDATSRAEAGIKTMKRTAAETGENLAKTVERAQALRDELHFLIEAADSLAQKLAEAPSSARQAAPPSPARQAAPSAPPRRPTPSSAAEPSSRMPVADPDDSGPDLPRGRGVLARADFGVRPDPRSEPRRGSEPAGRLPDLEDTSQDLPRGRGILSRMEPEPPRAKAEPPRQAVPRPPPIDDGRAPRREGGDGLSRAERELLEAMENRR